MKRGLLLFLHTLSYCKSTVYDLPREFIKRDGSMHQVVFHILGQGKEYYYALMNALSYCDSAGKKHTLKSSQANEVHFTFMDTAIDLYGRTISITSKKHERHFLHLIEGVKLSLYHYYNPIRMGCCTKVGSIGVVSLSLITSILRL